MAANNNDNISFGYPVYPIIKFKSDNFNDPDGTYLSEAIDYISNYIKVESDNVTKAYLIGMTDTLDNGGRTIYDSGIYITPETGEMAAKKIIILMEKKVSDILELRQLVLLQPKVYQKWF